MAHLKGEILYVINATNIYVLIRKDVLHRLLSENMQGVE